VCDDDILQVETNNEGTNLAVALTNRTCAAPFRGWIQGYVFHWLVNM